MKILKNIIRIIIAICVLITAFYLRNLFQKKGMIVTNSTKSVITKLHTVSKLETAEMTITKIMEAKKDLQNLFPSLVIDDIVQQALFQDKMIFELEGRVVAGIDLEKIQTGDIISNLDGSVSITLPAAEILHVIIDENSKPYHRQVGLLTKGDVEMETMIRNKAKEQMRQEAIDAGILLIASEKAHQTLSTLLAEIDIKLK